MMLNATNATISVHTILAPLGVSRTIDTSMPTRKHATDTTAAHTVTDLKRLHTRMDVRAGNIRRLDMSMAPIMRMPITTVTAVSTASAEL